MSQVGIEGQITDKDDNDVTKFQVQFQSETVTDTDAIAEDLKSDGRVKGHAKTNSYSDRDRKIGHRRINEEGRVSYKKIETNQLMGSIQLGIQASIGALAKYPERDLLMQDFMEVETTHFSKHGSKQTPAHSYADFTFR